MPDWTRELAQRLEPLRLEPSHESAVIAELAQHLDEHYRELLAFDTLPADAHRAVLAGLDHRDVLDEFCKHVEGRERTHSSLVPSITDGQRPQKTALRKTLAEFLNLETLLQDVRYGTRGLRNSPGFAAITVLTIALGIGATTAIFSVVDATLIHPLPYQHPEQLVSIEDDLPGTGARDVGMSPPEWEDLAHSGIFEYVSPTWFDENNLTGSERPARVRLLLVAPNYFALLGVKPELGRAFDIKDHSPGITLEAVISHGLWKRDFGGDPHILDKSIRLDTDLYHIVGVAPPGFDTPGRSGEERNIEVWISTSFYGPPMVDHPPRNRRNLPTAIARLKSGLTLEEAQSRVDALVAALQTQFPADYPLQSAWRIRLLPLKQIVVGNVRESLILLLAAVGLVLLIACVNVANLLLARASGRTREIAIRQAIGASQPRLVRQLLTESLLLSLLGGTAGLVIVLCLKNILLKMIPASLPRLNEISINWTVLAFALGASLLAGLIFGLAPAWQVSRLNFLGALRAEGRGSTASGEQAHVRCVLIVSEFALCFVLMISASLLLRSFWDLLNERLGFNPQNVVSVRIRLPYPNDRTIDKYPTPAKQTPFLQEVLRRSRTLSGVQEAAIGDTAAIPLDPSQHELNLIAEGHFFFTIEGRQAGRDDLAMAEVSQVTPQYFSVLGLTLTRGRGFCDSDTDGFPRVAIVNEAFAQTYWPGQDAVGKAFKSAKPNSPWITIVGVIANARTESLEQANMPQVYLSLYQTGGKHLTIFLRGNFETRSIAEGVRQQVQAVDPTLPVFGAQTLQETVSNSVAERRFSMEVVALFALAALLLAVVGIYGVISYMVSERRHEFGLRLALGADRRNILGLVLHQGLALTITGTIVGLAGALMVSHLMAGVLYGVKATDPLTFTGVALILIAVALIACIVPARRATRVDPMFALRDA